jgi:hypothetical protein
MRTDYENKALAATAAPSPPSDIDDGADVAVARAKTTFAHYRAVYDQAIADRDAIITELLPTFSRGVRQHPRVVTACSVIERAERKMQAAAVRYNAMAKARDRGIAAKQAAADRARVDEKRELRAARVRAETVGSRLRRLIGDVLS